MYDNFKYAYIVGRLRALETKMLNQSMLERMLDAPSAAEVFRTLNDMPLVQGSLADYEFQDFDKVLTEALSHIKRLLVRMAPYPEALDFLWHKYDFHNLKVTLKAHLSDQGYADVEHALSTLGTISTEDWQGFMLEGKKLKLGDNLSKKVDQLTALYEKEGDPKLISSFVDQYYLETLQGISAQIGSPMISSYLARMIDFSNLGAFIRVMELKKDRAVLEQMLLPGGFVKPELYLAAFERGYEELRLQLERPIGSDDLLPSLEAFMEHKTLLSAEKKAYQLQQEFMKKSKTISFGPEPVFAFYWQFENHMQIIRAILIGKLNGLPHDMISNHILTL